MVGTVKDTDLHFIHQTPMIIKYSSALATTPNQQHSSVVTLQINTVTILHAAQILPSPSVDNLEAVAMLQLGDLAPGCRPLGSAILRVEHKNKGATKRRGRTGPVLCRMFGIIRPVIAIAPFIGMGGTTDLRILVESKKVLVLEDREVIIVELIKLRRVKSVLPF